MAVGAVNILAGNARFVVILHDAVKGEGALSIKNASVDITSFVTGVTIVYPGEVTGRLTQRAFADVTVTKLMRHSCSRP